MSFNAGARMEYAGGATGRKHRARYAKLHLYDAFAIQESRRVMLVMKSLRYSRWRG